MVKCADLLSFFFLFLCLAFNSTHARYRNSEPHSYANQSQKCNLVERTKKMASNLENTLRRIKNSTQDFRKSLYGHLNNGLKTFFNKDPITEDEIRQYEELVIMKKYPYLDLKELEMKYSPQSNKNTRQSTMLAVYRNVENEPSISDAVEDVLSVEIINRGLSGFAIPPLLIKNTGTIDKNLLNNVIMKTKNEHDNITVLKKPTDHDVLRNLKQEINAYMGQKINF